MTCAATDFDRPRGRSRLPASKPRAPARLVGDLHDLRVAQPKSSSTRWRLASGSRRCASKPAEMMIRSGPNAAAAAGCGSPRGAEGVAAVAGAQRRVDDVVVHAAFAAAPVPDKAASDASSSRTARVGPENVLRAVAVMDVEVDDGDALGPCFFCAWRAAMAALIEEAEAHRPHRLGVMAGRALATKALAAFWTSPRRPPRVAPPTARSAASKVPGDIDGVGIECDQAFASARQSRISSM